MRACAPTRSGVVDENGPFGRLRPLLRVDELGFRASICGQLLRKLHTCFWVGPRTIGTYTWIPVEPVVLAYSPCRASDARSRKAGDDFPKSAPEPFQVEGM